MLLVFFFIREVINLTDDPVSSDFGGGFPGQVVHHLYWKTPVYKYDPTLTTHK